MFFSMASFVGAADYYLSPTGDDGDSGAIGTPWKTFAFAAGELEAGDALFLREGVYAERLVFSGKAGTFVDPIVVRSFPDEIAVIDGTSLTVPSGGRVGLVSILNSSHVHVKDLEIRNYATAASASTPVGILVEGSGVGTQISGCHVHHIQQNSTSLSANGFGIAVYGTSSSPIDGLVLKENEVSDLRTGQSESVVLNGNVTNFTVRGNRVHDCNNIGIDFIGYEGSAPSGVDRARDGVCSENVVYDIDSAFNPGYGGGFTTGGGDESAAGIYVDGGTRIVVERNQVYRCNFGIELASENASGFTDEIVMRNNLLHHNFGPGIIMGGYDALRGTTRLCKVSNNTLFRNDSRVTYGGQIALQHFLENNTFKNNILWANTNTGQMVIHYVEGGTAAQRAFSSTNVFDYNVYFWEGDEGDIEFGLNESGSNASFNGLAAWRGAVGGEVNSSFHDPEFVVAVPWQSPLATNFELAETSYCKNLGEPSPPFTPAGGEKDFAGASRVADGRVDVGCYELLSALQSWRDGYFEDPDGTSLAGDGQDQDGDGVPNLIEYSQGMNPTEADALLAPSMFLLANEAQFQFRKEANELTYQVLTSTDLSVWSDVTASEENDGSGLFWYSTSLAGGDDSRFFRLAVSY